MKTGYAWLAQHPEVKAVELKHYAEVRPVSRIKPFINYFKVKQPLKALLAN